MIEVTESIIEGIPILELVKSDDKAQKLPTVIFYHGWTATKETCLVHGYEIAKKGFRVLIPQALYHAGREDDMPTTAHYHDFWEIVRASVTEFPKLISHYVTAGLTDADRVGATGLSMGGITTCALLATYPTIKAADCLMGTPCFIEFSEVMIKKAEENGVMLETNVAAEKKLLKAIDLSYHPEKIATRPVHFWHGTADKEVPYAITYNFYKQIKDKAFAKNVTFTTTEHDHRVPFEISQETAEFFKNNL